MPRHPRAGPDGAAVQGDQSGSASADRRSPKRRKVRKGTHSCWACKRKKIRCTFSTPDGEPIDLDTLDNPSEALVDVVCDGCRRRGTPCVSQELPETAALSAAANHSRQVDDRLGRMEALVEMLVKNTTRGDTSTPSGASMALASPRSDRSRPRSRSGAAARRPRDAEQELADVSNITTNRCLPETPLGRGDGEDRDDGVADLGPDNLQQHQDPGTAGLASNHAAQPAMGAVPESCMAIHPTGMSPREPPDQRPTTYTTWFGHERGIGEEEQPGALPPPTTAGPATPVSTASMRCVGAATNSQAGSASTACTEPSPPDNANDGPARNAPCLSAATQMHQEYMNRYNALAAMWPGPRDLETILDALERPVRSGLHKVLGFTPLSAVTAAESPPVSWESARSLLKLPPVGAHLVLVAQKLLYLASFLQHMHPLFDPDLKRLSMPHRDLIQRIMCVTTTIVMGNDSLIGSFEGVQCLVMQGIIQSNQGNLRRAWLAFRRALTMAQLMGLHRGFPVVSVTVLDPSTLPMTMPKCMWFRILYADRYLSLMLGLPQGLPGDSHVLCPGTKRRGADAPKPNPPSELNGYGSDLAFSEARYHLRKIEEAHAVIAGRIIERNEAWRSEEDDRMLDSSSEGDPDPDPDPDNSDARTNLDNDAGNPISTRSIDIALQRASRSMPAQWWLTPFISETSASEGDGATNFLQTQQLIDQLFHYHLLTQLHLPYMLRRSANSQKPHHLMRGDDASAVTSTDADGTIDKYAYSKITCVSASREVLSRFLSLRSSKQVTFMCRCIDFFALLASMTLCLAHLDSHRHEQMLLQTQPTTDRKIAGNDFLAHQRLSDRGMMERVLHSMDDMTAINEDDALSAKSTAFLRRMLDAEHDASLAVAASLGCADAKVEMEQREARARTDRTDGDLRVWVPFLGTIRINKEGILRIKGNECSLKLPTETTDTTTCNQESNVTGPAPAPADAAAAQPVAAPSSRTASAGPRVGVTLPGDNDNAPATTAYPATASGAAPTMPSNLSSIGLPIPAWSSGDAYLPSSNPDAENPYMFDPSGSVASASEALVDNGGSGGNINVAAFGGFGNYGSDGYGNGSGGGYGNGSYRGVGQGDDWTLQGVDFAFFENLLMHGALGDTGVSEAIQPATMPANTANTAGNEDVDGGGPEDDVILTSSRRRDKLGGNTLWM